MKLKTINTLKPLCLLLLLCVQFSCSKSKVDSKHDGSDRPETEEIIDVSRERNLERAMELVDSSISRYFSRADNEMRLARYYNPQEGKSSEETGSVWMYTASIEAVNAVLESLKKYKDEKNSDLYNENFKRYLNLIEKLYDNIDFYLGTYTLTSYTQTKEWDIYAVDRVDQKGKANVEGVLNVYDDQMWLIRELLQTYKLTENEQYLKKAEYLTSYVLDGWDSTLDENGKEYGGITWGPGYVTKHSCSNGPLISSLVWLADIYEDKFDEITFKYILPQDSETRADSITTKNSYYLNFAKKIYGWQKENLLLDEGVYDDMLGGCDPCDILYEEVAGVKYRANTSLSEHVGPPITYNSGAMISGAYDLYKITMDKKYIDDAIELSDNSFRYFARLNEDVAGYYSYNFDGFNNWFNQVLLRSYTEIYPVHKKSLDYIKTFQQNLDYAYNNFIRDGILPSHLLNGWSADTSKNDIEAISSFALSAQYATLSLIE